MNSRSVKGVMVALAVAALTLITAAPAMAGPAHDVSDAMRYGATAPLGDVIEDLVGEDDATHSVAAPWPINFFGETYGGLCITTNGGVYPVADGSSSCSDEYDQSVEELANESSAPLIAVLAADTDLGECDDARVAQRDGAGDGFGRPCTIYLDTDATIDGRDAVVITWYRVSQYEGENDETLENTYQLVLIKLPTADGDTVGYDIDFEFNYGTLTDGEDGYSSETPADECESLTEDCRWGIGIANYVPDVLGPDSTEQTAAEQPEAEQPESSTSEAESTESEAEVSGAEGTESEGTEAEDAASDASEPAADEPIVLTPAAATGYEFFAATTVADLLDDGATPLVVNSLGTDVDGRYTCGMISGQPVGCSAVSLQTPEAELAETGPSEPLSASMVGGFVLALGIVAAGLIMTRRQSLVARRD